MRPLSPQFQPYGWALSTSEIAALAGIAPEEVLRFDGNTPPEPPATASPETVAAALSFDLGGWDSHAEINAPLPSIRAGNYFDLPCAATA